MCSAVGLEVIKTVAPGKYLLQTNFLKTANIGMHRL